MAATRNRTPLTKTRKSAASSAPEIAPAWTFLTNHFHVLLCLARDPDARMRDVAQLVGVTERAVQRIVADLEEGDYLVRSREGRRNRYEVRANQPLRHPIERHARIASLIALLLDEPGRAARGR